MNLIVLFALFMILTSSNSWYMGIIVIVGMFVYFIIDLVMRQESMLYIPRLRPEMQSPADNPEDYRSPAECKIDGIAHPMEYEDVFFKTKDDVKINAWFIECGNGKTKTAPTLLFCHANAGNIGFRVPNFYGIVENLEANVFAFDYRGYGASEGTPGETGIIEDSLAAWKWLEDAAEAGRIDMSRVFIFGRSLGGAVAIALSNELRMQERPEPCGLILENTFASIPQLVETLFGWIPFISRLKDYFLRLQWLSVERVPHLKVPLLFVSGQQDEVVPAYHTQILHDAAKQSPLKRIFKVEDGMHNDTWEKGGADYWKVQASFMDECFNARFPGTVAASS